MVILFTGTGARPNEISLRVTFISVYTSLVVLPIALPEIINLIFTLSTEYVISPDSNDCGISIFTAFSTSPDV